MLIGNRQSWQQYLGGRSWLALVAILVAVLGTWGFFLLAAQVIEGDTRRFDERAVRFFADHPGPAWVGEVMRDATALGGILVLTLITASVVGFLVVSRKRAAAAFVLAAVLGGFALSTVLKHMVDRDRPPMELRRSLAMTSSFPSGHSMMAATVYLTLGAVLARTVHQRSLKWYCVGVAATLSGLVGVSRVYLGVHWPTDVLAGWTAGSVWAILCWLAARAMQQRRMIERDG